ncbi:MAG: hypothetical protein ABIH85_01150 [Candidatus Omnitrophota bacterium]
MIKKNDAPSLNKGVSLKNLKWYEHIAIGWPLILIFVGGVLGAAFGGGAYFLNFKLFKSQLSKPLKYVYSFLVGIACVILYVTVIVILVHTFSGVTRR